MKTLSYKGFDGSIRVSLEDDCLYGKIEYIDDLVLFEGQTLSELRESFKEAVEGYLEACSETGKAPNKPFKGSFNVRIGPELHRLAAMEAKRNGQSLNEYVTVAVRDRLDSSESKQSAKPDGTTRKKSTKKSSKQKSGSTKRTAAA